MTKNCDPTLPIKIGPKTKYIISTSGRITSLSRYQILLQEILKIDIAYIPIHNIGTETNINPQAFIWALKGMPCIGGAISRDIKHSIISYLDELDSSAISVQAVNTVIRKGDKLIGYNTDAIGFKYAITKGIELSNVKISSAVCYGYGGVTSVVVAVLKELGIKVYLTGRRIEVAKQRAFELGVELFTNSIDVDLFVNATPASELPLEQAPNFLESLTRCKIAFDHEMPGKYLKEFCIKNSIHHIAGYEMYYPQMYAQWSLFLSEYVQESNQIPQLIKLADEIVNSSNNSIPL